MHRFFSSILLAFQIVSTVYDTNVFAQASCYLCTTPNIENHYGSFFDNPREVQETYDGKISDCRRNTFQFQKCDGFCFSLNVSSTSRKMSDFGSAYGCSTNLLADDIDIDNNCITKEISIRTSPVFTATATYCTCSMSNCNPPVHPPMLEKILRKSEKSMVWDSKTQKSGRVLNLLFTFILVFIKTFI